MNTKRAFTLVELLVVIVIIGILAAIITVAVAGAWQAMQRGVIATQMSQIGMALDRYRAEFGEYPPDMFDDEALVGHVRMRWPRYVLPSGDIGSQASFIRAAINTAYNNIPGIGVVTGSREVNFSNLQGHQPQIGALALWLGGFPNSDGIMSGFSADPENPFFSGVNFRDRVYDNRTFIRLELGDKRNVQMFHVGTGAIVPVIGTEVRNTFVPIVYFRGRADGGSTAYRIGGIPAGAIKRFDFTGLDLGWCVAYAESVGATVAVPDIRWNNPTTFQLIHPGLDGHFGEEGGIRVISTGVGITLEDLDNLTNFSDFKELRSILP